MHRQTIAVDFDGVIHLYESGWQGAHVIPDPPVAGAIEWLHEAIQDYEVVIFSTRAKGLRGRWAIRKWLKDHSGTLWWGNAPILRNRGIEEVHITSEKVPALAYLDDRAVRFEGTFPSPEELASKRPWNKDGGQ